MQSQAKIFCCLAVFLLCTGGVNLRAQDLNWTQLNSEKMEILPHSTGQGHVISSYIPYFNELGSVLWKWDPREALKNTSDKVYLQPTNTVDELMKNLFVDFDLSDSTRFRKVWFRPKEGLQFRGLFAIHDFKKKRPLIILRMGIHGNVDEMIAERFFAKAAFEDLDANLLVLESLTSHAFISANREIAIGGVDEGLQTYFVLNELNRSKLNSIVSDYHLLALSMGAHGTFVTAMLDQVNSKKIRSIVSFCPLINFRDTMNIHSQQGLNSAVIDLWNVRRFKGVFDLYPDNPNLKNWWLTLFDLKPRFTYAALDLINESRKTPLLDVQNMNSLVKGMRWPKGFAELLSQSGSLFAYNEFWPLYQGVEIPIMVYTTPKDPLVINEMNSEKIFRGTQPGDFKSLKYQRLEKSVHCGLASVYRWDYIVGLLRDGFELQ